MVFLDLDNFYDLLDGVAYTGVSVAALSAGCWRLVELADADARREGIV